MPSGSLSPSPSLSLALSLSFARSGSFAFWYRGCFVFLGFVVCSLPALRPLVVSLCCALFVCWWFAGCARASFCVLVLIFLRFLSDSIKVWFELLHGVMRTPHAKKQIPKRFGRKGCIWSGTNGFLTNLSCWRIVLWSWNKLSERGNVILQFSREGKTTGTNPKHTDKEEVQ